jgi:O-antigen/teichoic acid export membrane protein
MSKAFGIAAAARAVLLVTGSNYACLLFGLITSAVIARAVGPRDFGHYSYVMWISGLLVIVANNGLPSTCLRFVSESLGKGNPRAAGDVHGWLLRRQLVTLSLTALAFVLTARWTLPIDWHLPIFVFIGVVVVSVLAKSHALFEVSVAKGHGHFSVDAVASTVMSAVSLAVALGLYLSDAPAYSYMVLFAVANIVYYAIAKRMTWKRGVAATSSAPDDELRGRIRNHLFWTIVLTIAAAFGARASETYLLSKFVGAAEVGFFAIATALTRGGVDMLAVGLNAVLMPLMAHGYGQGGTARVHAILATSMRLFTFGGLLLAGVGFMWAEVVVTLMYGQQYTVAAEVLRVLAVVAGLTLAQSAFGALLSTTDHQKVRAGVAIASVLFSVVMALVFVPRFGLRGAVLSSAISSTLIYLTVATGLVRTFSIKLPWRELWRLMLAALVAAGCAAALLWLGRGLATQFVAGLAFAAIYLAGTVVFRAWQPQDIVQLHPLAQRFPALFGRAIPALERWLGRV